MLHDMSREFWRAIALAVLACGGSGVIVSLYFGLYDLLAFLGFATALAAGYTLRLAYYSKSRSERGSNASSGL